MEIDPCYFRPAEVDALVSDPVDIVAAPPRPAEVHLYRSDSHSGNFLECVRTRAKPVSDVEFGLHVQAALNMALLAYLQNKVARFDGAREQIVL